MQAISNTFPARSSADIAIPCGQLGNYLGALKNWVKLQDEAGEHDSIYFAVVGLHAITLPQDPSRLRQESRDMMAALLAIGLDPKRCTIFRQEQVKQHAELAWYLNCLAPFGRLQRMTTWKVSLNNGKARSAIAELIVLHFTVTTCYDEERQFGRRSR